jgi:hypothetical protein
MIRFALRHILAKFGNDHDYDTTYIQEVADVWPSAGLRYLGLSAVSQMKGPVPEIWAGALLASTLDGDCGPCAQLVVGIATKSGVPPERIAGCLSRDFKSAGTMGLGFRFAESALLDGPQTDALREEIRIGFGERAVIAAAYATASGRVYPVMKRALGHGQACRKVAVNGIEITVVRAKKCPVSVWISVKQNGKI